MLKKPPIFLKKKFETFQTISASKAKNFHNQRIGCTYVCKNNNMLGVQRLASENSSVADND